MLVPPRDKSGSSVFFLSLPRLGDLRKIKLEGNTRSNGTPLRLPYQPYIVVGIVNLGVVAVATGTVETSDGDANDKERPEVQVSENLTLIGGEDVRRFKISGEGASGRWR